MIGGVLIGLLNPLLATACAAIFAVLWKGWWPKAYVAEFSLGFLLYAAAFLLQNFPLFGDPANALISNVAITCFFFLMAHAILKRVGLPAPFAGLTCIAGVGYAFLLWFMFMDRDMTGRILSANFMYGAMLFVIAWPLAGLRDRKLADSVLLTILLVCGCYVGIRTMSMVAVDGHIVSLDQYTSSLTKLVLDFSSALFSLAVAFTLISAIIVDIIEDLRETSRTDPLSGLLNRRGFEERLSGVLKRHGRLGTPLALVICDLDHFKSINDRFGHACGDRVIAAFGKILREATPNGVAGRLGGEEFVTVLPDTNLHGARLFGQSLRLAVSGMRIAGLPEDCRVTASFGIAEMSSGESLERLLRRADMALLQAKRNGRDRVQASEAASDRGQVSAVG
ncbi:MAG: GGDEF domain-containing protein [Rhizobiaceae bacterium]